MANTINQIKFGNTTFSLASTAYAICSDVGDSEVKIAYIDGVESNTGFTLTTGVTIHVYFTYSNTHPAPLLQVNQTYVNANPSPIITNAALIKRYGTTAPGTTPETSWNAGEIVPLTYDGQYWQMNRDNSSTYMEGLLTQITEIEDLLDEYWGEAEDPDPTPDPEPSNTLTIYMQGEGSSTSTLSLYDEETHVSYSPKLYSGCTSMGHAYWDDGGSVNVNGPCGNATGTISNIFYYNHDRLPIAIASRDLTGDDGSGNSVDITYKNITGIDLYFNNPSVNASGYSASVAMIETTYLPPTTLESGHLATVLNKTSMDVYDNVVHLDFDTPYTYMGGNLMILIKFDSDGYNSSHSILGQITLHYEDQGI